MDPGVRGSAPWPDPRDQKLIRHPTKLDPGVALAGFAHKGRGAFGGDQYEVRFAKPRQHLSNHAAELVIRLCAGGTWEKFTPDPLPIESIQSRIVVGLANPIPRRIERGRIEQRVR
jgi:hypothetical protein